MNPIIIIGCFTPLVIIFIVMKFAVWVSAVKEENSYVAGEKFRIRSGFVENPYEDVDEEEEEYGDRTDYR